MKRLFGSYVAPCYICGMDTLDQILVNATVEHGKQMKIGDGPWMPYDQAAVDAALDARERKRPMSDVVIEALKVSASEIESLYRLLHKMHPDHWTSDGSDSPLVKIIRGVLARVKEEGIISARQ